MNEQVKKILIDGLILFAVSTALVVLADRGFSLLKGKAKKDDPIVTAIIQGDLKQVKKLAAEGGKVTNETDALGRTALMRAAYVNLSDPKPLGKKERALVDALVRCGIRLEAGAGPAPLTPEETALLAMLNQRGLRVTSKPDERPLLAEERELANALGHLGVPVGDPPAKATIGAGQRLAAAMAGCGIDLSDELAVVPSFADAGEYAKALRRLCSSTRMRPAWLAADSQGETSNGALARLVMQEVKTSPPVVALDPDELLLDQLDECGIRLNAGAESGPARRNVKALAAELAKWDVKLGNPLSDADEIRADMVGVLLDRGAKLDKTDNDGWTALMWAAWSGLEKVAEVLLERGAGTGFADRQGNTALIIAAQRGQAGIVKLLLARGAAKGAANQHGLTALAAADKGKQQYPTKADGYDAVIAALR